MLKGCFKFPVERVSLCSLQTIALKLVYQFRYGYKICLVVHYTQVNFSKATHIKDLVKKQILREFPFENESNLGVVSCSVFDETTPRYN